MASYGLKEVNPNTLGGRIRDERLDRGMSQEDLMFELGLECQSTISKLELNKRGPGKNIIAKLRNFMKDQTIPLTKYGSRKAENNFEITE